MAGDVGQDMGHAGQDMGQATDNIVTFPHRPSAMDLPETAGPANTAVTHEETDLENRSDGREDENDSDMMGAAAAAPKKTSMRQELHVEQSRLKEKGKTPSPRFNHILMFRTPSPGSAARRFNSILALRTPSPDHVRPSALFNTPKRRSTFNSQTLRRSRRLAMVARGDAGRPSAMDLPETAGPANTAVTHEETDLENRSDGREDENDSDMMGAAAAAPKKTSMRQELHVEQSRLKEKGKTPSPRFNHILTFRTPSPGSAARRFNSILALRTPSPDHVRPSALFNTPKRRSTFNSQTLRRSRRLAMVARGDAGRPSAMDLPETAGPANTAVTHEETDLENRSDGREDENDSDMMGAAAAAPKKTSMRQELHVEQSRLKEKGKTPSPRFNHILMFRTPSPGSAARRFNSILALRTPSPDHVRPSALFNTPKRRSTFNSQTLRRSRRLAMVARGDAGPTLCLELPCVSPPFASHDPLGAISR
ncbi:uncharacterized protein [Branchiostoma lanceolatum]